MFDLVNSDASSGICSCLIRFKCELSGDFVKITDLRSLIGRFAEIDVFWLKVVFVGKEQTAAFKNVSPDVNANDNVSVSFHRIKC